MRILGFMCGIVGYIGNRNATEVLMDGLRHLEYRGYDSAGIAVRTNGTVTIRRNLGKLVGLEKLVAKDPPQGCVGIGHTRWATHGRPSERNAHPHKVGNVILVHNGIIENYAEMRKRLIRKGVKFSSETDTEIACHLIHDYYKKCGDMEISIKRALANIEGSYAFVVMDENDPDTLYVTKKNLPMIIGVGRGEMFAASDIPAILPYTKKIIMMDDGEFGVITKERIKLQDARGRAVVRKPKEIKWDHVQAEKGGFKHFMLKEIFEQPKVAADTLAGRITASSASINLPEMKKIWGTGRGGFPFDKIYIIACGTSYHAALVGKYWIEKICRVPVTSEFASEFRYRDPIINNKTLFIGISQSGETADTLAAVKLAKSKKAKVVSICNVMDSSIPRASDATLYTYAGPEIGVASTKAFTAQLIVLLMFALVLGSRLRRVSRDFVRERVDELLQLPHHLEAVLRQHAKIREIAEKYAFAEQVLFIARGVNFPVALEGALKLKEISYIHAEGFAAGELKHGPIALVDRGVPVVSIIAKEEIYDKVVNNIEEVRARGGEVIALASNGDREIVKKADEILWIPAVSPFISPIVSVLPLQLFAYYVADHKGTDVDQPRNLAKSVTVE